MILILIATSLILCVANVCRALHYIYALQAIFECHDLRLVQAAGGDSSGKQTVLKLMAEGDSWHRELESRAGIPAAHASEIIVPVLSAALIGTMHSSTDVPVLSYTPNTSHASLQRPEALDLMNTFP